MRLRKGLLIPMNGLKYLGVFPWSVDKIESKIICSASDLRISLVSLSTVNLITVWCFYYVTSAQFREIFVNSDEVDYIYGVILMMVAGISQTLINNYSRRGYRRNLQIVQNILDLDSKFVKFETNLLWSDGSFKICTAWFITAVLCFIHDIFKICLFTKCELIYWIILWLFTTQLIFTGCIMLFYGALIKICEKILRSLNVTIAEAVELNNLKELLRDWYFLIELFDRDISELFGKCVVVSMWFTLMFIPSYVNVILTLIDLKDVVSLGSIITDLGYIIWIVPPLINAFAVFNGGIMEEANKTARILSRISRRGTGIEKMVDKFLMKNMQQKPILTAYGFFPLNKRTLFKIFAAIFTYMVILVQFKEMENTNKRLASASSPIIATTTELTVS